MDEPIYTTSVDRLDARPRLDDEPGTHESSVWLRPPGLEPLELRFYADGAFEIYDKDGVRLPCDSFERNEDGEMVFEFERPPE